MRDLKRVTSALVAALAAIALATVATSTPLAIAGASSLRPVVTITTTNIYADHSYASVGLHCAHVRCAGVLTITLEGIATDSYGASFALRAGSSGAELVRIDATTAAELTTYFDVPGEVTATVHGGKPADRAVTFVYTTPAVMPTTTEVAATGIVVTNLTCDSAIPCSGHLSLRVTYGGSTHSLECQFFLAPQATNDCDVLAGVALYKLALDHVVTGRLTGEIDNNGTLVDASGAAEFSASVRIKVSGTAHL